MRLPQVFLRSFGYGHSVILDVLPYIGEINTIVILLVASTWPRGLACSFDSEGATLNEQRTLKPICRFGRDLIHAVLNDCTFL